MKTTFIFFLSCKRVTENFYEKLPKSLEIQKQKKTKKKLKGKEILITKRKRLSLKKRLKIAPIRIKFL